MTLEGFAAERPVVTLDRQRRSARVRARRRDRARVRARAQGDRRGVRPALRRPRRRRDAWARPATRSSAPRSRAGPTSSRGCWTDAPRVARDARRAAARSRGARIDRRAGLLRPAAARAHRHRDLRPRGAGRACGASGSSTATGWTCSGRSSRRTRPKLPGYRLGIFQLGNNVEFHLEIYRAAFLDAGARSCCTTSRSTTSCAGCKTLGEPLGYMAAREAAALRRNLTLARRACATSRCASPGARTSRGAPAASSCTRAFCKALPGGARVPHAGLRGAASGRGVGRRRCGGRPSARAASCARPLEAARRAHAGRGAGRPERGEAARRRARGRAASWTRRRPRRAGGPARSRATTSTASSRRARLGDRVTLAPDVERRRLPRMARGRRRGGGPAVPASRRGERLAGARDAGGQARRS